MYTTKKSGKNKESLITISVFQYFLKPSEQRVIFSFITSKLEIIMRTLLARMTVYCSAQICAPLAIKYNNVLLWLHLFFLSLLLKYQTKVFHFNPVFFKVVFLVGQEYRVVIFYSYVCVSTNGYCNFYDHELNGKRKGIWRNWRIPRSRVMV